jgi:hypothetical protein
MMIIRFQYSKKIIKSETGVTVNPCATTVHTVNSDYFLRLSVCQQFQLSIFMTLNMACQQLRMLKGLRVREKISDGDC